MRRSVVTAAVATMSLLALAGCSNGGSGGPATPAAPSSTAAQTPSPAATGASPTAPETPDRSETPGQQAPSAEETGVPDDAAGFGTDAQQDPTWPGGGGDLLPTGVRIGVHADVERVVLDFLGEGAPGWRVEYVDEAVEDGSGRPVDVDGDAVLQVVATGVRYPEGDENDQVVHGKVGAEGTEVVEEVVVSGIFEGQDQVFIGLDEQVPFRVFTLTEPSRLVVDVQRR